jgi:hypothetical protein
MFHASGRLQLYLWLGIRTLVIWVFGMPNTIEKEPEGSRDCAEPQMNRGNR